MSNSKYIPLLGGKECRLVNPFNEYDGDGHDYHCFEAHEAKEYALTEVMPEGVEFDGDIQYFEKGHKDEWIKVTYDYYIRVPENWRRIAIKPIKAIEPVKESTNQVVDKIMNFFEKVVNMPPNVVENKQFLCIQDFTGLTNKKYTKGTIYKQDDIHIFGQSNFSTHFEQAPAAAVDELDLEAKAFNTYPFGDDNVFVATERSVNIQCRKAYIKGYTDHAQTKQSKVVELIEAMDGIDGQTEQWYQGYFAFKADLLTKLNK